MNGKTRKRLEVQIPEEAVVPWMDYNWQFRCVMTPSPSPFANRLRPRFGAQDFYAHEIETLFTSLDLDRDGRLSQSEVRHLTAQLGQQISDDELLTLMHILDPHGTGFVDLAAFKSVLLHPDGSESDDDEEEENLLHTFRIFDGNNDGFISAPDLAAAFSRLGFLQGRSLQECQKIIENVDLDKDGKISFWEFKTMMSLKTANVAKS